MDDGDIYAFDAEYLTPVAGRIVDEGAWDGTRISSTSQQDRGTIEWE